MRFPSCVFVLVLVWTGAVFSGATKYTASISEWVTVLGGATARNPRVFRVLATDTLVVLLTDLNGSRTPVIQKTAVNFNPNAQTNIWDIPPKMLTRVSQWEQVDNCKSTSGYNGSIYIEPIARLVYPPVTCGSPCIKTLRTVTTYTATWASYLGNIYWQSGTTSCTIAPIPSSTVTTYDLQVYIQSATPDSGTCTVPTSITCAQCAWPYKSVPDTSGCGCKVFSQYYESKNVLAGQCNAYCNSTSINGNQSYIDYSRSNFDVTKGAPLCACSDPISRRTIYRPASTCPVGTRPESSSPSDSGGLQKIEYDPSSVPDSVKKGAGSGGSSGKYDSSMNYHLRRIDSILGAGSGGSGSNPLGDSGSWSKYHDSLQYYGNGVDSVLSHDTGALRSKNLQALGDTSSNYNWLHSDGQSGNLNTTFQGLNVWNCPEYPDHEVYVNFNSIGINRIDTLRIGFQSRMQPYYPYIKILEQLLAVMAGFGVFMYIAAGSTGKDSV